MLLNGEGLKVLHYHKSATILKSAVLGVDLRRKETGPSKGEYNIETRRVKEPHTLEALAVGTTLMTVLVTGPGLGMTLMMEVVTGPGFGVG